MGQEIVHCSICGIRLRSSDFERGEAFKIDLTAYCRKCSPQATPPQKPQPSSSSTRRRKNSTGHIPIVTPRRGMEAVPGPAPFPPALLWGGGGLVVALIAAVALLAGGRSRPPSPPAPEPAPRTAPPVRAAAPPSAPRGGAPEGKPAPIAAEKPAPLAERAAPPADFSEIDRKVAGAAAQEKFREAFDVLNAAKNRIDTLEWVAEIQRRTRDLDAKVKALHADLLEKADQARKRGAEAEVAAIHGRIAKWELATYGVPVEKPVAAPVVDAAPPPPAPDPVSVPAPAPAPAPAAAPPKADLIPFIAAGRWFPLSAKSVSATEGTVLTPLEDGSILAGGANPAKSRYSIVVQTDLKGITAFRLELLPDRSLPAWGAGRAGNGNLVLTEFQVQALPDPSAASGTPVVIERASCTYAQDSFTAAHAIDGKSDTGWAIGSQFGRAHEATFETKAPVQSTALLIVLDHQSIYEQHTIGRFRISATTPKAAQELALRVPVIDPSRVDQAIQRGLAWLRKGGYPADYGWSANELILWTYVHAGVPESDPDFQKRLKLMLEQPLEKTYRVAIQAMILEELDRVAYQLRIWQCAQFLIDNQSPSGHWHYGTPTEFPKGVPTPAKPPVPTTARLDADGRRVKPKVGRKLVARKTRDGPAEGDNSNAQYAALGLRACFDAGIAIPEDTILRAMKWWLENQHFDEKTGEYAAKGWSYTGPGKDPKAYHAMTAGGISSLTIYEYMLGRDWKKSAAIKAGINWIAQSWTIPNLWNNFYYLYGLERAGILYGTEKFGRYAWYPQGAQFILESQDGSGAWVTPPWWEGNDPAVFNTWNTCFAILFLRHATRPLVASEDRR